MKSWLLTRQSRHLQMSIEERQQRRMPQEKEESIALVYLRLLNQEYGFLPISKELLPTSLLEALTSGWHSLTHCTHRCTRCILYTDTHYEFMTSLQRRSL